jgi:hypothetical protein
MPDKDEVPGSSPGRPTTILPAQRADTPSPVALPARLGRGGAARPPHPSSQRPCRSGRPQGPGPPPEPHPWSPPPSSPGHGRPHAANPALTTLRAAMPPLGCTAPLPAPKPTCDPGQPACPWPATRANPVRCPSASTTTTRSSPTSPLAQHAPAQRPQLWPLPEPFAGTAGRPDPWPWPCGCPPTRSTTSPVLTQRTRTGRGTCGHRRRSPRTPGHPDIGHRTRGHRTSGHRTRGHWTPDIGRVDADRGCGQGDQATTGIPISGQHDEPTARWTSKRVPVKAAPATLGNHDGSAVRPPPARGTAIPPPGDCSVAPPAVSGALAHCCPQTITGRA